MQHKEGTFKGCNDLAIYYQYWLPEQEPMAMLVLSHGVCEHSGFYHSLVERFLAKGYLVCGLDYPGHGKSEGSRGYIDDYSHYVDSLRIFIDLMRSKYPDAKPFLLGHSMGALIAATYTIEHLDNLSGLLLTSVGLRVRYIGPVTLKIATRLTPLLPPRMGVTYPIFTNVSLNLAVVKLFLNDPLVYKGKICVRWFAEMIKAGRELENNLPGIKLPALIMHGTIDLITDPYGSRLIYEGISSLDKTLRLYSGFSHSMLNDPKCKVVRKDIEAWLNAHTLVKSP
jgi:alpha-beta hydrolase superfamily lysophospholipase